MIHLYRWDNTDFTRNGDVILMPIMCEVTAGINRTWQVDLEHPIDEEGRWKYIEVGAVLKTPSFNGTQLWRIVQTKKSDGGITAVCDPIFYDAAQHVVFTDKVTISNATPQQVMDRLCQGTIYSAVSDITDTATMELENENLVTAVTGSDHGIVKKYDCEIGFDNYTIGIMTELGGDYGAKVLYGKNLEVNGIEEAVNIDGTVTRVIPIAYNGYKLPEEYVDSPLINEYPMPRIGFKQYENLRLYQDKVEGEESDVDVQYFNTKAQLYAAMRNAVREDYENGLDKPSVSISANMVMLENTEEYKDYKDLEKVSIGDYVTCKHNRLNIEVKTRVRKLIYDCIREGIREVELGDPKRNYFDNVSSVVAAAAVAITPNGNVVGERITGTIDGSEAQIKVQNTVDTSKYARVIFVEDLDEASSTYGALSLGTPGLQLSNERNGNDWRWETAVTPDGIVADQIKVGTLKGITIRVGGAEEGEEEGKDGTLEVYNADGDRIGKFDKDGILIEQGRIVSETGYSTVVIDNGMLTNTGVRQGVTTTVGITDGSINLDYGPYTASMSANMLWLSGNSNATVIEAGVISINGQAGETNTVTIDNTTLYFEGGILVGISTS